MAAQGLFVSAAICTNNLQPVAINFAKLAPLAGAVAAMCTLLRSFIFVELLPAP